MKSLLTVMLAAAPIVFAGALIAAAPATQSLACAAAAIPTSTTQLAPFTSAALNGRRDMYPASGRDSRPTVTGLGKPPADNGHVRPKSTDTTSYLPRGCI